MGGSEPPPDLQGPYLLGLTGVLAGISLLGFLAHRLLRSAHPTLGFGALLVSLAFAWYLTSVSFVLINRQVMGGGRKFSFPATLTLQHTFYKGILALAAVLVTNFGEIRSEASVAAAGPRRVCARVRGCCGGVAFGRWMMRKYSIDRSVWCKLIGPLAFATAADIFLSNLALRWVSVSLYTVAKSTALIFTYGLSLLFGMQGWSCSLLAAVSGVAAGVVMCSIRPTPVHVLGFAAVIVAAACSAARWVISQKFFERGGAAPSVMVLVLLQSPFTVALMAPLAAAEAPDLAVAAATHSEGDVVAFALMGVLGGLLAFLLLAVELQLIALTSALTANVIGHLKDIVAIAGSVLVLREELSLLNGSGAALTVLSALAYSALKARKAVRARRAGVHSRLDDLEPGLDVGDDPIDAAADATPHAHAHAEAMAGVDVGTGSGTGTGGRATVAAAAAGGKRTSVSRESAPASIDVACAPVVPAALASTSAAACKPASAIAGDEQRIGTAIDVAGKDAGAAADRSKDTGAGAGAPRKLQPPPAKVAVYVAAPAAAASAASGVPGTETGAASMRASPDASGATVGSKLVVHPPESPALAAAVHVAVESIDSGREASGTDDETQQWRADRDGDSGLLTLPASATASLPSEKKQLLADTDGDIALDAVGDGTPEEASPTRA